MSAPSDLDLSPGFALSPSAASLTAAQLLQLVSEASPYTDKGMVVVTTDTVIGSGANQTLSPQVPDAATTTKWQRYIWIRISPQINNGSTVISGALASAYIWNPGISSGALLCWTAIGIGTIGPGTITGSQIAAGTITDANISDVDWSKLLNVPSFVPPTNSITAGMIQNGAIIPSKLLAGGASGQLPRVNSGSTAFEWYTQKLITLLSNPASGDAGKPVVVNATEDGFTLGSAGTTQYVTYQQEVSIVNRPTSTAYVGTGSVIPTSGTNITDITGLAITTPALSASSKLCVEALVNVSSTVASKTIVLALFDSTAASPNNAVAVATAYAAASGVMYQIALKYTVSNSSTDARTFKLGLGFMAASTATLTLYVNSTSSSALLGGVVVSLLKVTEHS